MSYREISNNLLKEIEEEKGFSWKKLIKIIGVNGILRDMQ